MTPNFLALLPIALIPFFFAYIWFHPAVFGGAKWHNMAEMPTVKRTPIKLTKLLLSLLLNFLLAFGLAQLVLHQMGGFSLVGGNVELLKRGVGADFLAEYGLNHLSFGHGFFHGIMATLLFVVPILGYVTIFEKKTSRYFLVYTAYWLISCALMGGCISLWGGNPV